MVHFYISWCRSDPVYCNIFDDCCLLLSPNNLTTTFSLKHWTKQPKQLIVDSGAYYYLSNSEDFPSEKEVFLKQLKIINGSQCPIMMCPLDNPINPKNKSTKNSDTLNAIEKTLGNAYEFMELFHKYKPHEKYNVEPMGVIQGTDEYSITYCTQELKRIGYKLFGIGSLASLYNPSEIISRIRVAAKVVGGHNLHVFGVSRLDILGYLQRLNIRSIDSSRPMKAAIFNAVFYSQPFKSYGIYNSLNASTYSHVLEKPLPCDCPVCLSSPGLIMETGNKKAINARAIHNYHHLNFHLTLELERVSISV